MTNQFDKCLLVLALTLSVYSCENSSSSNPIIPPEKIKCPEITRYHKAEGVLRNEALYEEYPDAFCFRRLQSIVFENNAITTPGSLFHKALTDARIPMYVFEKTDSLYAWSAACSIAKYSKRIAFIGCYMPSVPACMFLLPSVDDIYFNDCIDLDYISLDSSSISIHTLKIDSDTLRTVPKFVSAFSELDSLYINIDSMSGIPDFIASMKKLKLLDISGTNLTKNFNNIGTCENCMSLLEFQKKRPDVILKGYIPISPAPPTQNP